MSMITTLSDENNTFLSRREITCDFKGLGGKLKKMEAVEMITKEFKLNGKFVIPIKLQNHTGQSKTTGIFLSAKTTGIFYQQNHWNFLIGKTTGKYIEQQNHWKTYWPAKPLEFY